MKFLISFVLFVTFSMPVLASRISHAIVHDCKSKKFGRMVRGASDDYLKHISTGGDTYLHLAAAQNRAAQLRILLNTPLNALIRSRNNLEETAIETAIMYGSFEAFEVLQDYYRLNGLMAEDETYLHQAAREDKADLLWVLLNHEQSPLKNSLAELNRKGKTAIEIAIMHKHFDAFSVLLERGDPNYRSSVTGWTLSHLAARFNQADMLWALHQKDAVMNARETKSNMRPIEAAQFVGAQDAVNALLEMEPKTTSNPNSRANSRSRVSISKPNSSPKISTRVTD